jgi:hypothetical protein
LTHRGTQVPVERSQVGVLPGQCESVVHCTHTPEPVLQIGIAPVHAAEFVTEHSTHWPLRQAGAVVSGHADVAVDPLSPLQGSQVPVVATQTGAVEGQLALELQ